MTKLKSARHHWWPECVSARWASENGTVGWMKTDGTCSYLPPKQLGVIGNGHHIKLARNAGETSQFDESFESEFDIADSNFPSVIEWLENLEYVNVSSERIQDRFISQVASDEQLKALTECIVSLAVRGPMNREASVFHAERLRGPIPNRERNALIGLNMRNSQRLIANCIGANGKFAVLYSTKKEFIFGDGFFHNVQAVVNAPLSPQIVAPVTPNISVIVARPTSFSVQPKLSTIVLTDDEVKCCNHAVQIYACQALYFRSEPPVVTSEFACGEHRMYSNMDNPIDNLIQSIPGMW